VAAPRQTPPPAALQSSPRGHVKPPLLETTLEDRAANRERERDPGVPALLDLAATGLNEGAEYVGDGCEATVAVAVRWCEEKWEGWGWEDEDVDVDQEIDYCVVLCALIGY
jgi:hypothetical protein